MSSSSSQETTSSKLEGLSATQRLQGKEITKINGRLDEILRRLEKGQGKRLQEDEVESHHFRDKRGNFIEENQARYYGRVHDDPSNNRLNSLGRVYDVRKKLPLEVADFYGKLNPTAFLDWIMSMEDYLDWYSIPENKRVRFVKMKLKGAARSWWCSVEDKLSRTNQEPIDTWSEMKLNMMRHFLPTDYEHPLSTTKNFPFKQGTKFIKEYKEEFDEQSTWNIVHGSEAQFTAGYKGGDSSSNLTTINPPSDINCSKFVPLNEENSKVRGSLNYWTEKFPQSIVFNNPSNSNGEVRDQELFNASGDTDKGQAPMVNDSNQIGTTLLCCTCCGHEHCVVLPSKDLYSSAKEPTSKSNLNSRNAMHDKEVDKGSESSAGLEMQSLFVELKEIKIENHLVSTYGLVPFHDKGVLQLVSTIDFIIPQKFNATVENGQIPSTQSLEKKINGYQRNTTHPMPRIVRHFKTRGRVFSNLVRMMRGINGPKKNKFKDQINQEMWPNLRIKPTWKSP